MSDFLKRILVPTDGSEPSDAAITLALRLARTHGSELIFCNVVTPLDEAALLAFDSTPYYDPTPLVEALENRARAVANAAARRATNAAVGATTTILRGRPAAAIAEAAKERAVDAIVMGTRSTGGAARFFLGSTTEGVVRAADIPTFIVRPTTERAAMANPAAPFERILIALDDSEPADAARAFACDLAAAEHSRLVFLHVLDVRALVGDRLEYGYDPQIIVDEWHRNARDLVDAAADDAADRALLTDRVVAEGDAADEILKAAQTYRADLIVMGTHGRRGLRRLVFGSVAEAIARRSEIPVAVVRTATPAAVRAAKMDVRATAAPPS
jgi:nucleotide-binding universal stress UspA family protein